MHKMRLHFGIRFSWICETQTERITCKSKEKRKLMKESFNLEIANIECVAGLVNKMRSMPAVSQSLTQFN